jgi:cephalosporin-C deacetylase
MAEIAPASTVYSGARNGNAGPQSIEVDPYNGHEGGGSHQLDTTLAFLEARVSADCHVT